MKNFPLFFLVSLSLFCNVFALKIDKTPPGYNLPKTFNLKEKADFSLGASLIYYDTNQDGMDIVYRNSTNPQTLYGNPIPITLKYKLGFKANLGIDWDRDNWQCNLDYTHFHPKRSIATNAHSTAAPLIQSWSAESLGTIIFAKGYWKVEYDVVDLVLSRKYFFGKHYILQPGGGFHFGWFNQNYDVYYTNSFNYKTLSYNHSRSYLFGFRANLNSFCEITKGLSFISKTGCNIFFQKFLITTKQENAPGNIGLHVKDDQEAIRNSTDISLGFHYEKNFYGNKWNFELIALYDFNFYFDQNMMKALVDKTKPLPTNRYVNGTNGDFFMHGLNFTAKLNF
ncbi:MAG TPA: Lpg1974 family pore-forming outer membrane protein [Chlamydiales bacterium]|nr:Lpg1974 family pore-forming outer membrane protein [Chlamydiales bacterium]